jgi:hypothetical protein
MRDSETPELNAPTSATLRTTVISLYHGICHIPPVAICHVFIIPKDQNEIYALVYTVKTTDNHINSHAQSTTSFKPYPANVEKIVS